MNLKKKALQLLSLCAALACALPTAKAQRMNIPSELRGGAAEVIAETVPTQEVDLSDKLRLEREA